MVNKNEAGGAASTGLTNCLTCSKLVGHNEALVSDNTELRYRTYQGSNRIEPTCSQVKGSKCRADNIGKMLHTIKGLLQRVPLKIKHQSLYATLGECPYVLNDLFD